MDKPYDHDGSGSATPEDSTKTPKTKVASILALFLKGLNLNRFEAERHHDHCLHSTVSSLEDYGVRISRCWETIPCLGGTATVRCKRYWMETSVENIAIARAVLAVLGKRV